jgi:hypothetical protein
MYNYLIIFEDGLITYTPTISRENFLSADEGHIRIIDITKPWQPIQWNNGWKIVEPAPELTR